ncbi:hypothetical protein LZ32DRAFT_364881 [Colletotrichum eremochloae]|nr:hypothetical protein LZ32DRAFT_364881 [Colletotrichum eremochloae]
MKTFNIGLVFLSALALGATSAAPASTKAAKPQEVTVKCTGDTGDGLDPCGALGLNADPQGSCCIAISSVQEFTKQCTDEGFQFVKLADSCTLP